MERGDEAIPALLTLLAATAAATCQMAPADRAWLDRSLVEWTRVEQQQLHLTGSPIPTFITADSKCAYTARGGRLPLGWSSAPHEGTIKLPDGTSLPVGVASFAAPGVDQSTPYFVMTLPSVWRAGGVTSTLGLDQLMTGAMLHELSHARQFAEVGPILARLEGQRGLPNPLSDDSLQETFEKDPAYLAAYEQEMKALFSAALDPDPLRAKTKARQGFALLDARQARWLSANDGAWAEADRLFLGMEGLGQWLMYRHVAAGKARPDRAADLAAVIATRRGGKYWSQDEGLAMMLVLDRFNPRWSDHQAADRPTLLLALAKAAVAH